MINISNEEKHLCCGCNACAQICPKQCIEMKEDTEGFRYPHILKDKCIECNLCEKVCPIIQKEKFYNEVEDKKPKAYGGWHKDDEVRKNSSSGGAFTLLAEFVLANKGVVYGAAMNKVLQVVHIGIEDISQLNQLRGSKYVQSDIKQCYTEAREQLKQGKMVLFAGTPCQIAGLHSFLNKQYDKLITCDFICHGVPSPLVFRKYLGYLEDKYKDQIVGFRFRTKEREWRQSGQQMGTNVKFKSGKEKNFMPAYKDVYMNGFLDDIYLRPSCYKCEFKCIPKYYSDITFADFWGVKSVSEEIDDKKGTSLILINSEHGQEIFDKVKGNFHHVECDFDQAIRRNKSLIKSVDVPVNRKKFFDDLDKMSFKMLILRYMTAFSWAGHKIIKILKRK